MCLDSVKRINCESDLALAPAHVPMHTSAALCPLNELLLCGRMLRDSTLGDRITRSVSLGFDDTTHIAGHCSTGCICLGNRLFVLRRLLFLLFLASCILHWRIYCVIETYSFQTVVLAWHRFLGLLVGWLFELRGRGVTTVWWWPLVYGAVLLDGHAVLFEQALIFSSFE